MVNFKTDIFKTFDGTELANGNHSMRKTSFNVDDASGLHILVINYNFGIDGILIGVLVGTILRWVMLIPHQIETLSKGTFSFIFAKKLLKFGLPFFPAAFFYLILEMSDRYLLFLILGPEAVGIYSIGYKLGSLALFIISAFN